MSLKNDKISGLPREYPPVMEYQENAAEYDVSGKEYQDEVLEFGEDGRDKYKTVPGQSEEAKTSGSFRKRGYLAAAAISVVILGSAAVSHGNPDKMFQTTPSETVVEMPDREDAPDDTVKSDQAVAADEPGQAENDVKVRDAADIEFLEMDREKLPYDSYGTSYGGTIPVIKDGQYGAINSSFEEIIPCEYSRCQGPSADGSIVMIRDSMYYVFSPDGSLVRETANPVITSGGMYIEAAGLVWEDESGMNQRFSIEYHKMDGTLAASYQTDNEIAADILSGFYHGTATFFDAIEGKYGILDTAGNLSYQDDPQYLAYLERHQRELAAESDDSGDSGIYADVTSYSLYLPDYQESTANNGYILKHELSGLEGLNISLFTDDFQHVSGFNICYCQPDDVVGFTVDQTTYNLHYGNNYRGFFHDGHYIYNYGSKMVWVLGDKDVLVDLSLYPGMSYEEPFDNRIVTAVYDSITMSDNLYWLAYNYDEEYVVYIDHNGREVARYDDATDFAQGIAMVTEDGVTYCINEKFEVVKEIGTTDYIWVDGELFYYEKDGEEHCFLVNTLER